MSYSLMTYSRPPPPPQKEMITDYLDVVLDLVQADPSTRNMTYYLSECLLLHARFGRYSASHIAAACLLEARILLGVGEYAFVSLFYKYGCMCLQLLICSTVRMCFWLVPLISLPGGIASLPSPQRALMG